MKIWNKFVSWIADNPYFAIIILGFLALWAWYDMASIKAMRQQRVKQAAFDEIFPAAPPYP